MPTCPKKGVKEAFRWFSRARTYFTLSPFLIIPCFLYLLRLFYIAHARLNKVQTYMNRIPSKNFKSQDTYMHFMHWA